MAEAKRHTEVTIFMTMISHATEQNPKQDCMLGSLKLEASQGLY